MVRALSKLSSTAEWIMAWNGFQETKEGTIFQGRRDVVRRGCRAGEKGAEPRHA